MSQINNYSMKQRSKNYKKKSSNNYKNNNKNKLNRKAENIVKSILALFALLGILSGILAFFDFSFNDWFVKNEAATKTEYVDVYLIPGDSWASDESNYGAWCWNDTGVPAGSFVLATDDDGDGIYKVSVSKEYKSMLWVDLHPGATQLGDNWSLMREQTDNLTVPTDNNFYYHQYSNEWSDSAEPLYVVTANMVTVKLYTSNWSNTKPAVIYCFDKTGVNEAQFIEMGQIGDFLYTVNVPAGYTHIIFIDYNEDGQAGSWDNILNQTEDLVIPTINNLIYDTITNTWIENIN